MNQSLTINVTTDAAGNAEVLTDLTPFEAVRLSSIHYIKPGAGAFADGWTSRSRSSAPERFSGRKTT